MRTIWKATGLAAVGTLALHALPASAQVQSGTHELHVYAGELFGDDLADTAISGSRPELDDDFTFGARYGYNFTDTWGVELSLGHSPNSVTRFAGGDIDLDITTLDLDAVWHFNLGTRVVPYLIAGIGYAIADLDRPIQGTVNGQPVLVRDDNGFTFNADIGAKYFATERFVIRLEGRYRYVDKLVDAFDDSLNTFETTLGVGWLF